MSSKNIKIYFSDFFNVKHKVIENYGALDISLMIDNPAFVDPFLIFYSKKDEYKKLHQFIVDYLIFLKQQTNNNNFSYQYYKFSEVKEVWLGFSKNRNQGRGLGPKFAKELNNNLSVIFQGEKNKITESSHLEKLCLVGERVGVDKISDFTLNLIKNYLVVYTEKFTSKHINNKFTDEFRVPKLYFDFKKGNWVDGVAILPVNPINNKEYVLLTPKDILVKEDGWISVNDFLNKDNLIIGSIPNDELRFKINNYFLSLLPNKLDKKHKIEKDFAKKYVRIALKNTAKKYPIILDYYIKSKEETGDYAVENSICDTKLIEKLLYLEVKSIIEKLQNTNFFNLNNSFDETVEKIKIFKNYLENRDGYRMFWDGNNLNKDKEEYAKIMLDFVFSASDFSVDKEINNGRGPADMKISKGKDSTLIELKLAKNTHLKYFQKQLDIYKKANNTKSGICVILYFKDEEFKKVDKLLNELKMIEKLDKEIFLIDCRKKDICVKS